MYVPGAAYSWVGCSASEKAPSPKSHSQSTIPPSSVLVFWKEQLSPVQAQVNDACGGSLGGGGGGSVTVTVSWATSESPSPSVTVSVTT